MREVEENGRMLTLKVFVIDGEKYLCRFYCFLSLAIRVDFIIFLVDFPF